MGLMNLFRKKEPPPQTPNAADYVEWLLRYMLRTSRTEITIDTTSPLPGGHLPETSTPPPCLPDAQTVINRLKILANINPIRKEGLCSEGGFERPGKHHSITFSTRFKDTINKSTCVIKLSVRCVST